MVKNISSNKYPVKKIIKIILLILISPIILLVLIILWHIVTDPIMDKFDHDKFIKLDTSMQGIFQKLKTASNGVDTWKYSKICTAEMTGDFTTGYYFCTVSLLTERTATSVNDINDLQAKYYSIIDNGSTLKQKTELDLEPPNEFGKNFVISSAEKHYKEIKSGVECRYLIELNQTNEDKALSYKENYSYGSNVNSKSGGARLSLECTEKARSHWYPTE
jgi:hypothetical protein